MTMFSDQQLYGSCYGFNIYDQGCKGYDLANYQGPLMAEDEARFASASQGDEPTQEERDEGWLQLSIGSCNVGVTPDRASEENRLRDAPSLELELLPRSSSKAHTQIRPEMRHVTNFPSTTSIGFAPSFLFQCPENSSTSNFQRHQEINNWPSRPVIPTNTSLPSSFSTPFSYPPNQMASGSFFPTRLPFQIYEPTGPRPGLDFRVIPPPRRPHSGIWFMLQASKNIDKELSLPQISKRYLRIKDAKMTIRLVIKYLVNKLSMENESEIEVTCRGLKLEPFLTLQHVRDNVWCTTRDNITLLPNTSTLDHIMVLHYARITSNS